MINIKSLMDRIAQIIDSARDAIVAAIGESAGEGAATEPPHSISVSKFYVPTGATATRVARSKGNRASVAIVADADLVIGNQDVRSFDGYPLEKGQTLTLETTGEVYALGTALGANVLVMEELR